MKKIFLFLLFVVFIFLTPKTAYAEVIRSFDVNIIAHKNGLMDVTETINYDFEELYRHGIFRNIPLYSKVGNLYRIISIDNVTIEKDGALEQFTAQNNANEITFKIGNPDTTITGNHEYRISYTVKNGIGSNFPDHDEIYWNATGTGWEIPIESASITIDTDFETAQTGLKCFTGVYESTSSNCSISQNSASASFLSAGEGLTAVAGYPVNTFPKSILSKEAPKSGNETIGIVVLLIYFVIAILLNIFLPVYLIYWYQRNKNKKRFGPPVVNFDIPKDENNERISPAISGTIDTAKLDRDDVAATIFDLAIRKYIRLEQVKKPTKVLGSEFGGEQAIIRLKKADDKLSLFETTLCNRLFKEGDLIKISDLKKDFYKTFQDMEKDVFQILVDKKYYTKNPKTQKALLITGGFFAMFTGNVLLALVLLFLGIKLNGRTPLGDEIDFKIDGLKLFLKSMDRNYKWQAQQLYIVEKMIPYAMALGYIDKFMEELKIIKPDYNPTWYRGYTPFYLGYGSFYSAATVISSAPSSSSGMGGGGFSGGGGGGGGGGSW